MVTIVSRVVSRLFEITDGKAATTSEIVASEAMILAGRPIEPLQSVASATRISAIPTAPAVEGSRHRPSWRMKPSSET